ncbi:MAG: hemerythrin domain-containing protein [Candidatus Rokubacteria bacterium]|nr:hemerythrin domain-containing protein [Candidatus Rokubacteria bacterium]
MVFVYLLMAIIGVAAVIFTIQNPDPVAVSFLHWRSVSLPLSLIILLSASVGVVVASISGFAQQIRLRGKIRKLERLCAGLSTAAAPARVEPITRSGLSPAPRTPIPIRGGHPMEATQFIKQEHDKAKAAFDKVLHASPQQRGQLWEELKPELKLHEQMEDACLYEPLARDGGSKDARLSEWREQHHKEVQKVEGLIEATGRMRPDEAAWLDKIKEVHSSLETHIREEEQDIFPRITRVWDEGRRERAGTQMAEMHSKKVGRIA